MNISTAQRQEPSSGARGRAGSCRGRRPCRLPRARAAARSGRSRRRGRRARSSSSASSSTSAIPASIPARQNASIASRPRTSSAEGASSFASSGVDRRRRRRVTARVAPRRRRLESGRSPRREAGCERLPIHAGRAFAHERCNSVATPARYRDRPSATSSALVERQRGALAAPPRRTPRAPQRRERPLSVASWSCRSNGLKSAPISSSSASGGAEQERRALAVAPVRPRGRQALRGTRRGPPCRPPRGRGERSRGTARRPRPSRPSCSATAPRLNSERATLAVSPRARGAAQALLEERLGPLVVADRQREVAEVVDRERGDPLVSRPRGRARPPPRAAVAARVAVAGGEDDRAEVAERVRDVAWLARVSAPRPGSARRAWSPPRSRPAGARGRPRRSARGAGTGRRRSPARASASRSRLSRLGQMPADVPEASERDRQPQLQLRLAGVREVSQRSAEVVVLGLEGREPRRLSLAGQLRLGLLGEREAPARRAASRNALSSPARRDARAAYCRTVSSRR